jgi:aquaporin Z
MLSAFVCEFCNDFYVHHHHLRRDRKRPRERSFAGIAIGLALTLIHLISIPVTNTSVNPARSLSQAVFVQGWALEQVWLFIAAPILGAVAGGIVL